MALFFRKNWEYKQQRQDPPSGREKDMQHPAFYLKGVMLNGVEAPPFMRTFIISRLFQGEDGQWRLVVGEKTKRMLDKEFRKIGKDGKGYAELYMDHVLKAQNTVLEKNRKPLMPDALIGQMKAAFEFRGDEMIYRRKSGLNGQEPKKEGMMRLGRASPTGTQGSATEGCLGIPYGC